MGASTRTVLPERTSNHSCLEPIPTTPTGRPISSLSVQLSTQGHEPFPDMDPLIDEEQIERRFASHQFPEMDFLLMNCVTHKCWAGEYNSAEAVLHDLRSDDACPVRGL
jgi:hypothetical protein